MNTLRHKILAKKLNFKNYFRIEYFIFKAAGFDLSFKEKTWQRPWLTASTAFAILTLMIGMAHYSWIHIDQLDMVTDALGPFVQSVLAIWKCLIFIYKVKDLVDLVHRVWDLTANANEEELAIIAKENRSPYRLGLTYCTILTLAVSMCLAIPITLGLKTYWTTGEYFYKAPLTGSYPFTIDGPLLYFIVYIWNLLGIYFDVCFTVGVDTLYSWSVHNITAQFQVLQAKIKALNEYQNGGNESSSRRLNGFNIVTIRTDIIHCIVYHQQTIGLAEQLNRAFRPIVLAEFTLNAAQLCFIVYQIGRGLDMDRMPFLCSFMLTILMQLLLYSHGGQHLEDESEKVALVVYESLEWNFWSIKERKMLLLTILRAQKSCKITAIFFVVNVRLFVWVLQTSASYVALLWSVGRN